MKATKQFTCPLCGLTMLANNKAKHQRTVHHLEPSRLGRPQKPKKKPGPTTSRMCKCGKPCKGEACHRHMPGKRSRPMPECPNPLEEEVKGSPAPPPSASRPSPPKYEPSRFTLTRDELTRFIAWQAKHPSPKQPLYPPASQQALELRKFFHAGGSKFEPPEYAHAPYPSSKERTEKDKGWYIRGFMANEEDYATYLGDLSRRHGEAAVALVKQFEEQLTLDRPLEHPADCFAATAKFYHIPIAEVRSFLKENSRLFKKDEPFPFSGSKWLAYSMLRLYKSELGKDEWLSAYYTPKPPC